MAKLCIVPVLAVTADPDSDQVSSGILCGPMCAGFPLTDAELSTSYTVLTAHAPDKMDWAKYAQLDTLVILMAASSLRTIMQHLLNTAWAPETPVSFLPAWCHYVLLAFVHELNHT